MFDNGFVMDYILATCTATSILKGEIVNTKRTTPIAEIIMADKLQKAAVTGLRGVTGGNQLQESQ
jgi:hypothetical protein